MPRPSPKTNRWHEVYAEARSPRPQYAEVLTRLLDLPSSARREMREQMAATLREMGVTFDLGRGEQSSDHAWSCDLLPHIMAREEWDQISRGFQQRVRAWEVFLRDIYGERTILHAGLIPVHAVLASPHYRSAVHGLPLPRRSFLHLCGLGLGRNAKGRIVVKQHRFGFADGISYMVQNRRALAHVAPDLFRGVAVQSLAESMVLILEQLRETAPKHGREPRVVLLSTREAAKNAPELSFLARRMGIEMVQGGDLVVLDDCLFLKTVRGLEQVDVVYNTLPDGWLDPLVFRRDSTIGVPGLIHCLRRGSVSIVNAVGSQLADDPTFLAFTPQIIRFYLGESVILPSAPTLWLGDLDQRELALGDREQWQIRRISPVRGADGLIIGRGSPTERALLEAVYRQPGLYVAQPRELESTTLSLTGPRAADRLQDQTVYAVRTEAGVTVLPGALTRIIMPGRSPESPSWHSKDTWVLATPEEEATLLPSTRRTAGLRRPERQVMSRVASSFYWLGRYLERVQHQAYLISVIQTLETEELNSAERRHYRPVWNRLLPPPEKNTATGGRSISSWHDRYRLLLAPEPGSVRWTFERALSNAEAVRESISPEAWAAIHDLELRFERARYRESAPQGEAVKKTQRLAHAATRLTPQFFAMAANTMLADDGLRLCETGQMLERAIITAQAAASIGEILAGEAAAVSAQAEEIELSAFLRLLGTRDAYRRIYQQRAEPALVLELLWAHPEAPRSVAHCLQRCRELLQPAAHPDGVESDDILGALDSLLHLIARTDWLALVPITGEDEPTSADKAARNTNIAHAQDELRELLLGLHSQLSDSVFSHQLRIDRVSQPMLKGW